MSFEEKRRQMVESQLRGRGIRDPAVLSALEEVPRELFLPKRMAEFAYIDAPLPIEDDQTISQPYMVALMAEALHLQPGARVLEIGTGTGYAAAVLSNTAGHVFTIERHKSLADSSRKRLARLGYENVSVKMADGSFGWPEKSPFDAIVVTVGGPSVPDALLAQLAVGGRLVMPVGLSQRSQTLVRITRKDEREFVRESLGDVHFVPLVGAGGWAPARGSSAARVGGISTLIRECAQPFDSIESVPLGPLKDRIGNARIVLLGEATHGSSEFYRMRTRITQELILRLGFKVVAVEADWPDAAQIDAHIRGNPAQLGSRNAFSRFPQWMWRNQETVELIEWLRAYNLENAEPQSQVSFRGLDLYSLYTSIDEVLAYLERVHPPSAAIARERYGRLTPWEADPAVYGRAVLSGKYRSCQDDVVQILMTILNQRMDFIARDGEAFFDAAQNARVVKEAESYYRSMYYGGAASWNLRDRHMFDTLQQLLRHRGAASKIVVWEHNSHIGDARATEMQARGEINLGTLVRLEFPDSSYHVGFGTDHGVVAAASEWSGPLENKRIRPAHAQSYERLCHDSGRPAFLLHLFEPDRPALREELMAARLERAIGVIYRPETELQSHYFSAVLPEQFDEYIWLDETQPIHPLRGGIPLGRSQSSPPGI